MSGYFRFEDFGLLNKLDTINDLSQFFDNTNNMYKEQYNQMVQQIEKIEDEEERAWYFERYEDDLTLYGDSLPRIIKYGILGNLFSHLEYSFFELAQELKTRRNIQESVGHNFDKYLDFLKRNLVEGTIPEEIEEFLDGFRLVRNRIIHSNGYVNRESSSTQHIQVMGIIESNTLLELTPKDQILVLDEYIIKGIEMASDLVKRIHYLIYE